MQDRHGAESNRAALPFGNTPPDPAGSARSGTTAGPSRDRFPHHPEKFVDELQPVA